ncbi:hypothetical protein RvY_00045 [Ramazzottius varieornatus]|uniref:UBC core domain-containing protein n=1 Tax=Ramazzottius varieornatus TaxID=947166 RepID=A0A1D1UHP0_RAMVA|nr:hypothetical protein RvY_00045 [Ramazzottius varieornatus]
MSNGPSSTSNPRAKLNNPANQQAARVLMQELQSLQKEKTEGFTAKLVQDDNLFEWEVAIFGPPDTLYAGGYYKAIMNILHPQTDNQRSGELPSERWNPTQNAYSVLMSIISLLNEPNTNSPANVEASIMYRRWKEKGDKEYERIIKEGVEASRPDAARDGVKVPTTMAEYCVAKPPALKDKPPLPPILDFNFDDDGDEPFDYTSEEENAPADVIINGRTRTPPGS